MVPLFSPAAAGGGAVLSSVHHCSLKFAKPIAPLFSKHRSEVSAARRFRPLALPNAAESSGGSTSKSNSSPSSMAAPSEDEEYNSVSVVGEKNVPLEGVIRYEKPDSGSLLAKWGLLAVLVSGDVASLLLFSAIGRFSHGLSIFDLETFKTADPFIAGWFLSAYFLGGYREDGKGKNGLRSAVIAAAKSWSLGIPLGIMIRAITIGHIPPTNFILVTMGSTGVLLVGWRALLFSIFPSNKNKGNDVYKRGSPFELFELLTSLVRRW
ncbi:uncharacterized protein LOC127264502 [Andrographis paniculata]|uniref:uncharacterized protein LOC127264502 n=1 Tax=Andrographis paniculata TaxID=175694 RepID=UPI0021E93620|nr:uncharacterized protein LOC127264502 [Andrographis paniculata]